MSTIRAIYEQGVFRPLESVDLPEQTVVTVESALSSAQRVAARERVLEILSRRFDSGETDVAARHNEHQP